MPFGVRWPKLASETHVPSISQKRTSPSGSARRRCSMSSEDSSAASSGSASRTNASNQSDRERMVVVPVGAHGTRNPARQRDVRRAVDPVRHPARRRASHQVAPGARERSRRVARSDDARQAPGRIVGVLCERSRSRPRSSVSDNTTLCGGVRTRGSDHAVVVLGDREVGRTTAERRRIARAATRRCRTAGCARPPARRGTVRHRRGTTLHRATGVRGSCDGGYGRVRRLEACRVRSRSTTRSAACRSSRRSSTGSTTACRAIPRCSRCTRSPRISVRRVTS